jgi:uncharacterized protein involved in response to NO
MTTQSFIDRQEGVSDPSPEPGPTLALPPSAGLLSTPLWRREPYRILFPLGALLSWAAVSHWLLLALRVTDTYLSIFHAMAQVQGFLTCYAVGFLFTFIPRRTGTLPPAAWQMAVAIAAPLLTSALALAERWAASQVPWIILLLVVVGFAARRARSAAGARRGAPSFVWVPLTLVIALFATFMTGAAAAAGGEMMWVHDLGRAVLLQGMFTGLALGIGSMLIPVVTRGESPPELGPEQARRAKAWHLASAAVFFAAFWVEAALSVSLGFALRAASTAAVLWFGARAWRRPTLPGLHRWLVLIAVWCIPLGNALVAALPEYRQAGLHVLFIGGFALLTLTVSAHVALTHGGWGDLLRGRPPPAIAMAALLAVAVVARMLVVFDQTHFYVWLGIAASAFLGATLAWAMLFIRGLRRATPPPAWSPRVLG